MIYPEFNKKIDSIPFGTTTRKNRKSYYLSVNEITNKFREALSVEYGISGNPKEKLLWDKAWSLGHSSGYYEVEWQYQELAELVK